MLKALAPENDVTLISFYSTEGTPPDVSTLKSICKQIIQIPSKSFDPDSIKSKLGFFAPIPRSVVDTFSSELADCIQEVVRENQFDIAIASQIGMAGYRAYFRQLPAIFEEVELGVPYQKITSASSLRVRARAYLTWLKHRQYIGKLLAQYQACTVASSQEKELLQTASRNTKNVTVIPNCIDLREYDGYERRSARNTLIFTGSFRYQANYEAMVWFLGKVFPLICDQVPDVELVITGDHCGLPLPTTEQVKLAGYVDDIRAYIAQSRVSLAPLLTGGGTRLKILEAMALGVPVVATSKGAEGLEAQAGRDLFVADRPEDFARAVIRLLREPETRKSISENGRQFIGKNYDWTEIMPRFLELIENVASVPNNPGLTDGYIGIQE